MSTVSIREFSYNPSAMFARVEQGEQLEVTRHGEVIAVLIPAPRTQDRYEELVARGEIRPAARNLTAGDWDEFTHIEVPDDVDPVAMLLEMREHER
jgi:prevent-host-death family protein